MGGPPSLTRPAHPSHIPTELMAKAGVRGIPHAFVVDATGTITFSGHPMEPGFESKVQAAVEAAKPAQVGSRALSSSPFIMNRLFSNAQVPLPLITESYTYLAHICGLPR